MRIPFFQPKKKDPVTGCSTDSTEGVEILTGNPKKAIISLSTPLIIAMLLMSSYNVVNAIWVAGLGSDALAAVGFISPMFMILLGLGTGIGAGATSAIARKIGAGDRNGASNTALHGIVIAVIISLVLTIPLVVFAKPIAILFGAGTTAGLATSYGQVIFGGTFFIIFVNAAYGILRAEGDAKRTMYAMVAASILNIILDPILIYGLGLGVAGAAWGTVISLAAVTAVLLYWFFVKKDLFVCLSWRIFAPCRSEAQDILTVGIPASVEYLAMSILNIILNLMLVLVANTDSVAVFSVGFRVVSFGIVPVVATGTVVVSVVGAAYGARHIDRIRETHRFAILFGILIALCVSTITWVFANQIAAIFSYSQEGAHLYPTIAAFIQVMCLFYPFVPLGLISSSVLQGVGKGPTSLFLTIMRSLVFAVLFAYLFTFIFGMGETGIWWGIVAGEIVGGLFAFFWVWIYLSKLEVQKPGGDQHVSE
ncbi:MATE family efflux transporter [Methanoregula sp.]|uniref:MATE family efflux transporter n=1 Tax=Methanoregula sp. TaxID=2052170 RepID=UPI003564BEF8